MRAWTSPDRLGKINRDAGSTVLARKDSIGTRMEHGRPGRTNEAGRALADAELDPPFDLIEPKGPPSNLVLSSPHSGCIYTSRFLASARLDATTLRRSEDAYVDDLFGSGVTHGAPLLRARFPRAFLDVNREPYELDPRMFDGRLPAYANTRSPRVAGGLGTIARVVGEAQEIYARRLDVSEAIDRIDRLYKPYHAQLRHLIERARHDHGRALLVDCHSMPSTALGCAAAGRDERFRADVVLGDRYGTSCDRRYVDIAEDCLRGFGYEVHRNRPYAGGFITEHYGHPATHRHALQVEVNRAIYMDERTLAKTPGFELLRTHLGQMVGALTAELVGETQARAAAE